MAIFKGHTANISGVCFAPKRCKFFTSVSQDNTLKVWKVPEDAWDADEGDAPSEITSAQMTIMAHQKYINAVKVSPNDKIIATSSQDKTIKLWEASSLKLQKTLTGHSRGVWDIQFSPSDQLLASAGGDANLKVWSIQTGQSVATLQGHKEALVKIAWLNLGLQIASASVDGVVKVWNVRKQMC